MTSPVHQVGQLEDADGLRITIGSDCDAVTIAFDGSTAILDVSRRDHLVKLLCAAEWEAELWASQHPADPGWAALEDTARPRPTGRAAPEATRWLRCVNHGTSGPCLLNPAQIVRFRRSSEGWLQAVDANNTVHDIAIGDDDEVEAITGHAAAEVGAP